MPTIEYITLTGLVCEQDIGTLGYKLTQVVPVQAQCFMSAEHCNKPTRVVLPDGADLVGTPTLVLPAGREVLDCERIRLALPKNFDVTEMADMDAVTQLVREAKAEREEAQLEALEVGARVHTFVE